MGSIRLAQVGESIRDVLGEELSREWDFGSALVSITHVVVSPDLSEAKVLVSILAGPGEQEKIWKRLRNGARVLQRCVAREVRLKKIPHLILQLDTSIQEGTRVLEMMKHLEEKDGDLSHDDEKRDPEDGAS